MSGFVGHTSVTIVPTSETLEDRFQGYDLVDDTFRDILLGTQGVFAAHA